MRKRSILTIEVDSQGRLVIPAALGKRYGFAAGTKVRVEEDASGLRLSRSTGNLARVYVEATNQCNLDCVTCMRNVWDEPPGRMSEAVFQRVLEGVREAQPAPCVFFGGYGEPLTHPRICDWVAQARRAGALVELITNGILLTREISQQLIDAGLERIWVSLDGATPESYEDVRLGAALPVVIENLRQLNALRAAADRTRPSLGIACVVMKRNIRDLPELVQLGKNLGADQFSVTNVLAHTAELRAEMLYCRSSSEGKMTPSIGSPLIRLPRIDINALTGESLLELMKSPHILAVNQQEVMPGGSTCPFVEKGSVSVRWDGSVSPCLPLLHDHASYLDNAATNSNRAATNSSYAATESCRAAGDSGLATGSTGRLRRSLAFSVGRLEEHSLLELWNLASYQELRERLLAFDFSPCSTCNSCEMASSNEEDCFGNTQPACGGCLWGQGFIQCP